MNKPFTIGLVLASGLMGGLVSRYIAPQVAFAQGQLPVNKEVRAQSFTFVDPSNRTVAKLSVEQQYVAGRPARIVLKDSTGHEIWSAGGSGMLPLNITSK